jgi:hypothetical protein
MASYAFILTQLKNAFNPVPWFQVALMAASMANNREVNIAIAIVNNNDLKSKAKPNLNAFTSPNEGYLITHSLMRRVRH